MNDINLDYTQILELKKRFCEKLAENRTEIKNSVKYIQRIIIILFFLLIKVKSFSPVRGEYFKILS